MKTKKQTNTDRLENFKNYVYSNKNKISYRTYIMFNNTCTELLENFLTTRQTELLFDLKDHLSLLKEIIIYTSQNKPTEEKLTEMKRKYIYYIDWINSESDMGLEDNI